MTSKIEVRRQHPFTATRASGHYASLVEPLGMAQIEARMTRRMETVPLRTPSAGFNKCFKLSINASILHECKRSQKN